MGNINIEHMIDIQTKYLLFWNGLRFTLYKFSLYMKPQKSGKIKISKKKNSFKEHNFIENADIKHCKKL